MKCHCPDGTVSVGFSKLMTVLKQVKTKKATFYSENYLLKSG